ncbi:hypothetical protein [Microbacterium suaedae]|uniref:hypothetical protein n=1 Tax=Microbacterium suaedae TaxID=2067813 RepID=UPI000DA19609|nr:hypothetical protein [Microbacterium suaedae]
MTSVRARASVDSGGWVEVPALADARERERWAAAVVDAVARAHGERFDPELAPALRKLVVGIAADREESDLLRLAFLPTPGLIASTVRVAIVESQPAELWREAGYALSPIRTERMGEGMLASRTTESREDGQRLVGHECMFVFTSEDLGIAVRVPPIDPVLFDRMQAGLTDIVRSLVVEFDDGRAFTGEPVAGLPGGPADTWHIGTHDAS